MRPALWELPSLTEFSKRLAKLPLKYQPGSRWEYSVSIDIAGYLVDILSEMTFSDFLETRVFDPLKMKDTGFWVPDSAHNRLVMIYMWDYDDEKLEPIPMLVEGVKLPVTLFSGGGGLVSSIEDYARFGQMLLNGGKLEGARILEAETVDMIMSDQLPEGVIFQEGVGYGLGGSLELETGVYHWSGMASTFFWADPSNDLLVLCFSQFIPVEKYAFGREFREQVMNALVDE
jgi:CubicO group peptidase (beta-lactamase class C family)